MKQPTRRNRGDMQVRVGAFELTKRGGSRHDWRDPYHIAVSLHWWQFALAVVAVEVVVNLVFGLLYLMQPGSILNLTPGPISGAFFFSIETLATVGYGVMSPHTLYGHIVSSVEILTGIGFTAIVTGLIFFRFARARARLWYANQAVVSLHNGQQTLMIRVANPHSTVLTGATATLTALLRETTAEGRVFRFATELPLLRSRLPIFQLTWTVMHSLDANSPLAGYDAARMASDQVRLFLLVSARDVTLEASVSDTKDYGPADIVFGVRYADAVSTDAHGNTVADITRLNDLEPDAPQ